MSQDTTAGASAHIELRGVDFAYTDIGSGLLVLDAHGLTSSRANNRRMELPDFSSVTAGGRRLISYDARGHGGDSGTRDPEDYTWAALAQDLLAFAEHFSPDSPVSAIGSSMGTGTIINAAAGHPDGSTDSCSPRRPPPGRPEQARPMCIGPWPTPWRRATRRRLRR